MAFDISELLILYDIVSFALPDREEDLIFELIERSTRLFGVRRLALITNEKNEQHCLRYWGFQGEDEAWDSIEKNKETAFLRLLERGKLGLLYLEQESPISKRERRLYQVFTRRIEEMLKVKYLEQKQEGNVEYIISAAQDIAEQKRTEEAIRESEEKFKDIYLQSPTGIGLFDSKGHLVEANKTCLDIFGVSDIEEIKRFRLFKDFKIPDDIKNRLFAGNVIRFELEFDFDYMKSREFYRTEKFGKCYLDCFVTPLRRGDGASHGFMAQFQDITERKRAEEELKFLSFHDKLTGLYNRAFFEKETERLDTARQLPISVIIGDVNCLKLVNDAFGHQAGDKLLKKIARILKDSCRKEDIVARWGGDEFAILLPGIDQETAEGVCKRIKEGCENAEGYHIQLSIALGTATKKDPAKDIKEVIKEAENKMYKSKLFESRSVRSSIISSLERAMQEETHEKEDHIRCLQELALRMGRRLELSDSQLNELMLLAALHDIGKIAISENILMKNGNLSSEEWKVIRKHPEIGFRIAQSSPDLAPIAEAIWAHHERWDGKGYPRGLKGDKIPLISRILAVVDAFDVMTHGRPYREPVNEQEALKEIKRCAGSQFDPELVKVFLEVMSVGQRK